MKKPILKRKMPVQKFNVHVCGNAEYREWVCMLEGPSGSMILYWGNKREAIRIYKVFIKIMAAPKKVKP